MKHQWLAYVIVGLLSIGAGVAIAGPPNNVPVDPTIIPTTTTEAPEVTVPATTVPAATTTIVAAPAATTTTVADTIETTEVIPAELPDRGDLVVAAASGANVAGVAQRVADELTTLGYVDVLPRNGSDIVEFTVIDYSDGFEEAALRLADDLAVLPEFVAPLDEAPAVDGLSENIELAAYIGRDRA